MKIAYVIMLLGMALISPGKKEETPETITSFPSRTVAMCGTSKYSVSDSIQSMELLPGMGNLQHPVSTQSALAQKYFNQGLSLIYGFNHNEAIRSFKAAAALDPSCAMAYWGIAYAWGPNINQPMTEANEQTAYEAIQKAKGMASKVSVKDAAYINALALRYTNLKQDDHSALDNSYIAAMKKLAEAYPDDADAQTLYGDALMNTFAWQYWEKDGQLKPRAEEVYTVLGNVLRKYPRHVGANHLMIHLVEGSDVPERGMKSASVLADLMPGAGHIVHMPSHIYIRTGNFDMAKESNIEAVKVDEAFYGKTLPEGTYAMYYGHNIHFLFFTANMLGESKFSMESASRLASKVRKDQMAENPMLQEMSIAPFYSMIRFGRWNEMLSEPDPGTEFPYMRAIWHFGRGMAYTRKGNLHDAAKELVKLDSISKLEILKSIYNSLDPVNKTVGVASHLLKGELALAKGETLSGIASLKEAVRSEDLLIYNEPPTWPLPVREYLGAALLEAKNYQEAGKIYREDLNRHPENGWSLLGLQQALLAQNKKPEAAAVAKQFEKFWSKADVKITSSRF